MLAFTDFNGRTASGTTASNLGWTLNGLNNPGNISNDTANLFNTTTFTQNNFTPGVNVGNLNSSWIAVVSITVTSGFNVTIQDITLSAVSVSGGQALNADRRNDYTLTLLNPSSVIIQAITIADVFSGTTFNQPTVTFDFADVALTLPGTYTLQIRGGDFTGTDETGNHTGIDNLSINGSFSAIPEPSTTALIGIAGLALILRRRK